MSNNSIIQLLFLFLLFSMAHLPVASYPLFFYGRYHITHPHITFYFKIKTTQLLLIKTNLQPQHFLIKFHIHHSHSFFFFPPHIISPHYNNTYKNTLFQLSYQYLSLLPILFFFIYKYTLSFSSNNSKYSSHLIQFQQNCQQRNNALNPKKKNRTTDSLSALRNNDYISLYLVNLS